MNVGQLAELLERLPADMPVVISASGGARHVTQVDKNRARRPDGVDRHFRIALDASGRLPAALILRGEYGAPLWMEAHADEVPFEITGHWPAAKPRRKR